MDYHYFPINNRIARYVLAVHRATKSRPQSERSQQSLSSSSAVIPQPFFCKFKKPKTQKQRERQQQRQRQATDQSHPCRTSGKPISAYLPRFQLWSSWWPPQTPGQQQSDQSDQINRQNLLVTLKPIFPLPSLSNSRNIWSIKTLAFLCSTNERIT